MFEYLKFKIIKKADNTHWLFNQFVNSDKALDGRRVVFTDGSVGNHQIKHPNYSNWFDIPKDLIQIVQNNQ